VGHLPGGAAIVAELGRAIVARVGRPVDFLHLPVPKDRDDAAYFAPLRGLRLAPSTRLYLGLIHHDDVAGDRRRIDAARTAVPAFGIAAECGWGRTDPGRVDSLLASHRQAVDYLLRGG
jgi:hypothetical protein